MEWSLAQNIDYLLALRDQMGPVYGSDDLCMLMYSFVKREKPKVVVELGTGLGVTAAWIAAAMRENGFGRLYTYDNGGDFRFRDVKTFLSGLRDPLNNLAELGSDAGYVDFLNALFQGADLAGCISLGFGEIDLNDVSYVEKMLDGSSVDMLFSDFSHSPEVICGVMGSFLPLMSKTSSIFIDSASTYVPSFLAIERLVDFMNCQKLPEVILSKLDLDKLNIVRNLISNSFFRLIHLVENRDRAQNSTALIRIEPYNMFPSGASVRGF
ncbi:class I SAM-dependent methyltransferase [Dyella caseinilytica]|uniref:Class I SAM-dependent methyltransferase n=1 Tax=Dyella caseinilytica TaxID=1849581 RepID=A0ABX7GWR7_9GAMM|nr:class I SAM-dependent methyltransferase [Dyella caseinilytica]QRN54904.1 class I SAM-dependent methyltransferase [Dyella caseinilytica]GFZ97800.1 hypothetical protein GCM10011408_17880 [Dyella caseinilytica]